MEVDQLLAFERVAREGSFSRAAWTLHVAQLTISARIAALVGAVGGPLFHRAGRQGLDCRSLLPRQEWRQRQRGHR